MRGERVFLRPLEPEDVEVAHRWNQDGEFRRLLGVPATSLAGLRAALERTGDDAYRFAICRIEDGRLVGMIDLFDVDRINGSAGFGIGIGDRADRGRGYGSDAVNALVDHCFGELRLERVWLVTDEENIAGQRTYASCGFVEEARHRRMFVDRGRFIDGVRMSLLREDWAAMTRKRSWDRVAEAG